jgi:glycine cleavage system H protein
MASPQGLFYSKDHEWVRFEGEIAVVGITDYAQHALGDIVFVELPRVGKIIKQFDNVGVVESVKSVSDLLTPIGGEVTEINSAVEADSSLVNQAAFEAGWLFKVKVSGDGGRGELLDAAAYDAFTSEG